jgi:hypothetical protein
LCFEKHRNLTLCPAASWTVRRKADNLTVTPATTRTASPHLFLCLQT